MRRAALFLALLLLATPAPALPDTTYLANVAVDITQILPPPPAPDSKAQAADMAAVMAAQKTRTKAEAAKVLADAPTALSQFSVVLGPGLNTDNLPKLNAFLTKVVHEVSVYSFGAKDIWNRQRPFEINPAIHPPRGMINSTRDAQGHVTPSYPSGNAVFGTEMAILLSEMVPEKRQQLFARGRELGEARVIGGVHYPSDVEAGRTLATVMMGLMMQIPAFRADLGEARAELRTLLKLPVNQ